MGAVTTPTHQDETHAPARCGAKCRHGGPCPNYAMANGRCRMHGGKQPPPGPGHPNYKHGRNSKIYRMPGRLRKRFEQAMDDPNLIDITRDVALVDTLIDDQLNQLTEGDPVGTLEQLCVHWDALEAEKRKPDPDIGEQRSRLASIGKLIVNTRGAFPTFKEIISHAKTRAGLAEKQHNYLIESEGLMSTAQVLGLLQRLHSVIVHHCTDERTRVAVAAEIGRLAGDGPLDTQVGRLVPPAAGGGPDEHRDAGGPELVE